ncbi:hypothetical protein ACFXKC_49735 [Streptomyces sp. NPDC059340]|uniref:hypothetical protein n=1 Tax=Streptomyces sp. NPDC059340 TaxID=3346806 RepID=UPI003689A6E6
MEGWLQPAGSAGRPCRRGRLGAREVEELASTARAYRTWDHKYGGGLRRKAVLGQLSEVAAHLDEHQAPPVEQRLATEGDAAAAFDEVLEHVAQGAGVAFGFVQVRGDHAEVA